MQQLGNFYLLGLDYEGCSREIWCDSLFWALLHAWLSWEIWGCVDEEWQQLVCSVDIGNGKGRQNQQDIGANCCINHDSPRS